MSVTAAAPSRGKSRDGLPRALRRNGIPRDPDRNEPLPKRLLKSRLFWLTVVMIVVYLTLLLLLYVQVVPDREVPGGTLPGLGTEAIPIAIKYAAVTAIPLSLLFLWADRYRPQRFWVWLMTFGWGACVATFVSAQINSWAAGHLSIVGNGDKLVETVVRPIFLQHLFLCNQDDVTAKTLTLPDKVAAFEVAGETDDV